MGIIFDIEELTRGTKIVKEFEADGEKSEDDTEEYSIGDEEGDNDGGGDSDTGDSGEGTGGDEGADGKSDSGDGGGEEAQDAGEDEEYTLDEPDDSGSDEGGEGEPEDEDPTTDDEYTLNDEEGGEDSSEEGDNDTATDDEEYSLDGDGEDSGESEGDTDDEGEDDSSSEDTESKLKELEGEIFDNLSPEQKQIKIDELKRCYQELYERCDNIIELLNDAKAPDENTSKVFEYINNNLVDLKQYIYDYFSYTFDTKTYLENNAQYQKHLVVLNSFDDILKELREGKNKNDDKTQN